MKPLLVVFPLLILFGIGSLILWFGVLNPKQSLSSGAQAVVVFAGGRGERFDYALNLVKTHEIEHLFVSVGAVEWPDRQRLVDYCYAKHHEHIVVCVQTDLATDNTQGEAKLFAHRAQILGLNHLVAVSGQSHVYRASLRLSQSFNGVVDRMGAPENAPIKHLAHEWLGIIHAKITR